MNGQPPPQPKHEPKATAEKAGAKPKPRMRMNAAWAAVIGAVFGMIGTLGSAYITRSKPPSEQGPVNPKIESLPSQSATSPAITDWVTDLKVNVAYQAKEDGFVATYSGGNDPAKGVDILTGLSPEKLTTRTRAGGQYDGAVLPIRSGEYWLVRPQSPGTITVEWLASKK